MMTLNLFKLPLWGLPILLPALLQPLQANIQMPPPPHMLEPADFAAVLQAHTGYILTLINHFDCTTTNKNGKPTCSFKNHNAVSKDLLDKARKQYVAQEVQKEASQKPYIDHVEMIRNLYVAVQLLLSQTSQQVEKLDPTKNMPVPNAGDIKNRIEEGDKTIKQLLPALEDRYGQLARVVKTRQFADAEARLGDSLSSAYTQWLASRPPYPAPPPPPQPTIVITPDPAAPPFSPAASQDHQSTATTAPAASTAAPAPPAFVPTEVQKDIKDVVLTESPKEALKILTEKGSDVLGPVKGQSKRKKLSFLKRLRKLLGKVTGWSLVKRLFGKWKAKRKAAKEKRKAKKH